MHLKQEHSFVDEYFDQFKTLKKWSNLQNKSCASSRFVLGLRPCIREKVQRYTYKTLNEAYSKALEIEKYYEFESCESTSESKCPIQAIELQCPSPKPSTPIVSIDTCDSLLDSPLLTFNHDESPNPQNVSEVIDLVLPSSYLDFVGLFEDIINNDRQDCIDFIIGDGYFSKEYYLSISRVSFSDLISWEFFESMSKLFFHEIIQLHESSSLLVYNKDILAYIEQFFLQVVCGISYRYSIDIIEFPATYSSLKESDLTSSVASSFLIFSQPCIPPLFDNADIKWKIRLSNNYYKSPTYVIDGNKELNRCNSMMIYALPTYYPISSCQNLHAENVEPFYILCDPSPNAIFFTLPCDMSFVVIWHVENLLSCGGIFGPQILSAGYGDIFMPVPVPPPLLWCLSVFDIEDLIFLPLQRCLVKWKMRHANSAKWIATFLPLFGAEFFSTRGE